MPLTKLSKKTHFATLILPEILKIKNFRNLIIIN